jgi:hypothetical protein
MSEEIDAGMPPADVAGITEAIWQADIPTFRAHVVKWIARTGTAQEISQILETAREKGSAN